MTRSLPDVRQLSNREAARAYMEAGFAVFPLRPGSKMPATKNGLHDATTNLDELWSSGSEGIGLPLAVNGLVAIDVDTPDALFDELRDVLSSHLTAKQVTDAHDERRAHYVFDTEGERFSDSTAGFPSKGWGDVKGLGYIVVEPTSHPCANESSVEVRENPSKYRLSAVYRFQRRALLPVPARLREWLREARESSPPPRSLEGDSMSSRPTHWPSRADRRRIRQRIVYPQPPAYLADVPDELLTPDTPVGVMSAKRSSQLLRWLSHRSLPRPTLLQLEAERRRRGIRGIRAA